MTRFGCSIVEEAYSFVLEKVPTPLSGARTHSKLDKSHWIFCDLGDSELPYLLQFDRENRYIFNEMF